MTPIEEHHGGIAVAYDAQLSLSGLAPSPNRPGVAGWYLDPETLSRVLASPTLTTNKDRPEIIINKLVV